MEFMKYSLRAIIRRCLSLDEELSSDELEGCLQNVADSFLPLKYILQTRAEDSLILNKRWSQTKLRNHLQKTANAFLPLLGNMPPVLIVIKDEKILVPVKGEEQEVYACYYGAQEEAVGKRDEGSDKKPNDRVEVSREYLNSCRYLPGKWVGLLLHELIHAYVWRTFSKLPRYKGQCSWAEGHNVRFFSVALSIQVQLELVLFEWESLQSLYGDIDLHLQGTFRTHAVLARYYYPHLDKARHRLVKMIEEAVRFLLPVKEDPEPLWEDSYSQFSLMPDEDYEDECSGVYGDVIYCPKLFRE